MTDNVRDLLSPSGLAKLQAVEDRIENLAIYGMEHPMNTTEVPFYYLAGKMSGIPAFNFPAFDLHAHVLRDAGYVIVSPAELDHEKERAAALASPDGNPSGPHSKPRLGCLRRDLEYVLHDNCLGVICMPGWVDSAGARWETDACQRAGRPIYEVHLFPSDDALFELSEINRDLVLARHNKLSDVPMADLAREAGVLVDGAWA